MGPYSRLPNRSTPCLLDTQVLRHLGKFSEAEPLQRQAVELSEEMMGKNHPNTATYLGNLAQVSGALRLQLVGSML